MKSKLFFGLGLVAVIAIASSCGTKTSESKTTEIDSVKTTVVIDSVAVKKDTIK